MTNTNIQQNTKEIKENRCIKNLKSEGGVAKYTAVEILLDSNELASDILSANGFAFVNEEGFAKYDDVYKFYGVAERYFAGVFQRNWISSRGTPEDIHKTRRGTILISAKMSLALSAIMYQGRNIPENSKVMEVYQNLKGTRYYNRAAEKIKKIESERRNEHNKRSAAIEIVEKALSEGSDMVEISPNGKILMSVSELAKLVSFVENIHTSPVAVEHSQKRTRFDGSVAVTATREGVSKKFESMGKCAKYLGVYTSQVSLAASHPERTVKGYSIAYA